MSDNHWSNLQAQYGKTDWINGPSMFAETVKGYLPRSGKLLELGAGLGQDSAYFAGLGYAVTATDLKVEKLQKRVAENVSVREVDLRKPLPFKDDSFDIVYAHLSLHYFDQKTTEQVFDEAKRVLKSQGLLAFFTNSADDPQYGTGRQIEPDYFEIDGTPKRYLTVQSALQFAHAFRPSLADNKGETYKDSAKDVHNLIRFIGVKE